MLFLARRFLLSDCHAPWPLASSRIRMRPLAPHWQAATMSQPTITADVHQPFDVHLNLFPQIAFDIALLIDHRPDPIDLFLGKLTNAPVSAYMRFTQDLVGA